MQRVLVCRIGQTDLKAAEGEQWRGTRADRAASEFAPPFEQVVLLTNYARDQRDDIFPEALLSDHLRALMAKSASMMLIVCRLIVITAME
jgi:hypothetical protein